jgi:conjugal transfer/entry exclusion protein
MSTSNKISKTVVAVTLTLAISFPAQAIFCANCSTEWTQIANNIELISGVAKQVETVKNLVTANVTLFGSLQQQILAGMNIGALNIGDVLKIKSDLQNYQTALKSFGGDLGGLQNLFDQRLTAAALSNLSFVDYIRAEQARIAQGDAEAKARVKREQAQAAQIQVDADIVKALGNRIPGSVGVQQSTQLLNDQVQVMLQQLVRMNTMTNEAQGSDKAKAQEAEAEARMRDIANLQALDRAQQAQKALDQKRSDQYRNGNF